MERCGENIKWLCYVCNRTKNEVVRMETRNEELYWICKKCLKKALKLFEVENGNL